MLPRFHVPLLLAIACSLSFAGECEASNSVRLLSRWRISDEPMNTPGGIGGTGHCVNPAANLAPAEIACLAGQAVLG